MMINEKDKQAILDGAYGITRNGRKVKFIGRSTQWGLELTFVVVPDGPINYYRAKDEIDIIFVDKNHFKAIPSTMEDYKDDVVGLWANREVPFNLKDALAGKPVLLRNGIKAEISKALDAPDTKGFQYFGLVHNECADGVWYLQCAWNADYKTTCIRDTTSNYDIVGMWASED